MASEDAYEQTVMAVAADVLGLPEARLTPEHSMSMLKARHIDYQLIFERSAAALGVEMTPIIETMPIYTVKASDATMSSLSMLGGVSSAARALLARLTVAPVDDTLASIAASLRTGRFVDSGRKQPPLHKPYSLRAFFSWLLLPPAVLLVGLPVGVAWLEFRQCCEMSGGFAAYVAERAWRGDGPILVGLPVAIVVLAVQLWPGLASLREDARLRRERQDL